jgi:hypothetical protein
LIAEPIEVFQRLQSAFPGSALGWAGEGDAALRLAEEATEAGIELFTPGTVRSCEVLYQRADEL